MRKNKTPKMPKNYSFVHDYAVIIITANSDTQAEEILREVVKDPDTWNLDYNTIEDL